jgi:two-component system sensor histidine kinase/response regulator
VGSTFWFSVPLQCGHGPMPILVPTGIQDDAESRLSTRHRGARVLLAEDNPINVEVVLEILHAVGIDVAVAENGREAVDRARQQTFDLILMDMQMPEIGGIEATHLIRGLPRWADRPIIALTANAFAEDRRACLEAGMNDVLTKPVEPGLLYATMLHWLAPTVRGERAPAPVQNQRVFDASADARVILGATDSRRHRCQRRPGHAQGQDR